MKKELLKKERKFNTSLLKVSDIKCFKCKKY